MQEEATPPAGRPQEGLVAVGLDRLAKVLGSPSYRVYRVLLDHRDPGSENWMLRLTLAKKAGLRTGKHAHNCLERLTRFGLVIPGKWRRKRRAGVGAGVTVRTRVVLGGLGHVAGWALVPARTFTLMLAHKGRGGDRTKPEGEQTGASTRGKQGPTEESSKRESLVGLPSEALPPAEAGPELLFPLSQKLALPGVAPRPKLRQARIPAPPAALPADDDDAAEWVARLYASLRTLRSHGRDRFGWRGPLRKQTWWKALRAGVAGLREHDLNAVQWLGWSFALWGGRGSAPLAWVLSPARMAERKGWFQSEADDVAFGGRVVPTPASEALWMAWRAMQDAVYRIGPASPNRVREVAAQHLTPDEAERLTLAANVEAETMAVELAESVQKGRWVWL